MRTPFKAGIAGVALATAGALFLGVPSASGTHQSASSAYGVSVGGQEGQPKAAFPEGPREAGATLPGQLGPLASGGALQVTAGNDQATASVTDLTLGAAITQLPPEVVNSLQPLRAACTAFQQAGDAGGDQALAALNDAIAQTPVAGEILDPVTSDDAAAFCNGILDEAVPDLAEIGTLQTQCQGDTGGVTLTDVSILGADAPALAGEVAPNTSLLPPQLDPVASITLNRQTQQGDVLTVDGLVIEVGGMEVATLASVTCGAPIAHNPTPTPTPTQTPAPAPAPTPVVQDVPVTG